jgi:tetratricopeptide (TPR) repeat protein
MRLFALSSPILDSPSRLNKPAVNFGDYSPGPLTNFPAPPFPATTTLQQARAEHFKEVGNEMLRMHLYPQAIQAYQQAIQSNPSYTDAYFNLAQTFKILGQLPQAAYAMTQMLFINPNDHDGRVTLGEYYERMGLTQISKRLYMQVLGSKPNFDPAKRNLGNLIYQDQLKIHPDTAEELLQTAQREVLFKARNLLKTFYSTQATGQAADPELAKLSQNIKIQFSPTQVVENTENIAEYDHANRCIRLQSKMMFSSPNVIAAYLAHELVHAKDNDGETSVVEEQDGYRALAQFWKQFKHTEDESNLDRALKLYNESQARLDQEVRRLYTMRNPLIAERSPGHGLPSKTDHTIKSPSKASQKAQTEAIAKRAENFNKERLKRWIGFYEGGV